MDSLKEQQPGYTRVLIVVALAAFALRTVNAVLRPYHTDERISLQWGSLPVKDMLEIVRTLDVHPPLLFLMLHALNLAHAPNWVPRMIAVALGTASVLMLCAIVRIWAGDKAALVAGACAAFMPILVFYDTWIRMYVLSDTCVLAQFLILSWILTRTDARGKSSLWLWVGWSLAAVLAGYTLYLSWFATLAQVAYLAFARRDRLAAAAVASAVAVIAFIPQIPALLHQLTIGGQTFQGFRGSVFSDIVQLAGQATLTPELEGAFATAAALFAWLWLALALYGVVARAPRSPLPWLGAPALITFLYGIATHKLIYLDRYYIFLAYALAAWTGCLFVVMLERRWRVALASLGIALAGVAALGTAYAVDPMFYTADWPSVAAVLSQNERPGDLVLAEQGMPYWTLPGDEDIISHEHLFIFYPSQIPRALRAAARHNRVWVIAYEPRGIDPDLLLLHTLGNEFRLASARPFNRYLPAEDVVVLLFAR